MKNETAAPDMIIVGGGVIGLAIAEALAESGRAVTLVERDRLGRGASWAAGGMLSPLAEAEEPGSFLTLAREALELYPAWCRRLSATSGIDVGLHLDGKTLVATSPAERDQLQARWRWQRDSGHEVRWVDREGLLALEPALGDRVVGGLHLPGDGRVNNRALVEALAAAARAAGARILEGVEVTGLVEVNGRVSGVRTSRGTMPAGGVIIAAGARAPELVGLPPHPVKGQMLELRPEGRPLRGVIAAPGAYLIPRDTPAGHRIVIGATMEDAGFDTSTDPRTLDALHTAAAHVVPALATAVRTDAWAGSRPGSPTGLPLLGPDAARDGLLHAHAHHRNGILLAPITARILLEWIAGRPRDGADAFLPT